MLRVLRAVLAGPWVRWGFLAVAVIGGAAALAPHRHAIAAAARDIGVAAVLGGAAAALAGLVATMLSWRAVLRGLGSPLPPLAAARVFFVGQLGKYVPGSLWPIVAQMELARAHGVPRHRTATAALLTMAVSLAAGLATAAATLPLALDRLDERYRWLLAAAPLAAAALHPRVLNAVLGLGLRVTCRPPLPRPLPGRAVLAAAGWALVSWALFGVHVWVLLAPFAPGPAGVAVAAGGFALAWCVGFLLVVAPAGAGARDLVLIGLLATLAGSGPAAAVALLSRAVLTGADLLLAGAAALARTGAHGRTSQHSRRRGSVPVGRRTS
ncbi:lysylphosphatidylglycerol synthase domain-containing protein [Dactylosporangium sp. CA-233914]|uniref:lysylphosphatidylglycerol synthase domain-containing protein n=1 Tax=Dactylosporangium sp. CA-233914 TaxID=3239934 RepID=UPI003D93A5B2